MEKQVSKLLDFYHVHKRMPTYAEMMKLWGYKTKSAVAYSVTKLIKEGILFKDKTGHLLLKQGIGDLKVLGLVEAGFPTSAQEEMLDTMSLDEYLIDNKEASYMLKVKGESMIDAGIMPGDLVIVERGAEAKPGDIVIAEVDGSYTLKYYRIKNKKAYLEASNKNFKNIYPEEELKITAVVRSVIRKY